MSGPVSFKGDPISVAWAIRWINGEDDYVPLDYERRRPTTTSACEAAFVRYRALTLSNQNDSNLYPPDWPLCPTCGGFALDGRITCGRSECDEHGQRRKLNEDEQADRNEEELGTYR